MIQIRPWLYHGKYRDTINAELMYNRKIKAILHLADNVQHAGIETLYIPIDDGEPIPQHFIKEGLDFVMRYHPQTILIACGAGISRSTTFTAGALKLTENLSLLDALQEIKALHDMAMPHPAVWQSMCEYFGEPFNINDVL